MITIKNLDSVPALKNPLILTIGNFDGLHRGHKKVIRKVIARARELGGTPALMTFEPHPRSYLHPENSPPLILTREEKIEIISRWGVELFIEVPFTKEFAGKSADEFLTLLYGNFSPREVYIGEDFRFGAGRRGNIAILKKFAESRGCFAEAVSKLLVEGEEVSATRVRSVLLEGDMEHAHKLLGRPFEVRGEVVPGDHRGRELGYPTANIAMGEKLTPATGVYITCLDMGAGLVLPSVSNLGGRPTFHEKDGVVLEIHVLKGTHELYGRKARCLFFHKLRDEVKFRNADELVAQIAKDKAEAELYFEQNPLIKKAFY